MSTDPTQPTATPTSTPTAIVIKALLWVFTAVVLVVTVVSIFVEPDRQATILGIIEKLAGPILAGLMAMLYGKLSQVETIVNSKSDRQDKKIADLEAQVASGRQSAVDTRQAVVASQQVERGRQQGERSERQDAREVAVGDVAVIGAAVAAAVNPPAAADPAKGSAHYEPQPHDAAAAIAFPPHPKPKPMEGQS